MLEVLSNFNDLLPRYCCGVSNVFNIVDISFHFERNLYFTRFTQIKLAERTGLFWVMNYFNTFILDQWPTEMIGCGALQWPHVKLHRFYNRWKANQSEAVSRRYGTTLYVILNEGRLHRDLEATGMVFPFLRQFGWINDLTVTIMFTKPTVINRDVW